MPSLGGKSNIKILREYEEMNKPTVTSSGSTAIYSVTMEWESGKRESISVDAENKNDAMAKAFRKAFGLTNIVVQCQR